MSPTFLIRIPRRAAAESAATIAVGVARMNAHGQRNDEHGDDAVQILRERPDQRANDQHQRRVKAHVLIHDPHDRQLGFFRRQNQFAHSAERRVLARAADFDFQHAGQILRAGENFVARLFVHRQRFTGDGRLVERTLAGHDHTVRRHVVAGTNANHIANRQILRRDFFLALPVMRRALVGVSLISDSIEARAPSAVRVSMISPINMKNATTPAVL